MENNKQKPRETAGSGEVTDSTGGLRISFTHCSLFSRRRQWPPTPGLLPGKSHGRRSLVGCSPWGPEESDTTERLHFHFSLSCIGEGNGNPLQCSCLENPRDGGAWWAAIYGVAQSQTRLRRLSSSSSTVFYRRSAQMMLNLEQKAKCRKSLKTKKRYFLGTPENTEWKTAQRFYNMI